MKKKSTKKKFTEKNSKELENLFKEKLAEQYNNGMIAGMKTACHVIAEYMLDEEIPIGQRVVKVLNFCTTTLKSGTEETEEHGGEQPE